MGAEVNTSCTSNISVRCPIIIWWLDYERWQNLRKQLAADIKRSWTLCSQEHIFYFPDQINADGNEWTPVTHILIRYVLDPYPQSSFVTEMIGFQSVPWTPLTFSLHLIKIQESSQGCELVFLRILIKNRSASSTNMPLKYCQMKNICNIYHLSSTEKLQNPQFNPNSHLRAENTWQVSCLWMLS